MHIGRTRKDFVINAIIYTVLSLLALSTIVPLLNIVAVSLSDSAKAAAGLVTVYPLGFDLSTYRMIFQDDALITAAVVSAKRVALALALHLTLVILASYPLSKTARAFPGRNVYMWIIVITMLFPPNIVPLFFTVRDLGLLGSIWALVLPAAVGQFFIILTLNFFRSLPQELDESASIDGAGPWRRILTICLPLSKPIIATIALFIVVGNWNAYFDGLIFSIRMEDYPLQTYIQQLVVTINPGIRDLEQIKQMVGVSNRSLNAAKMVVTMIPIVIVYPFLQKYFISGMMIGAVKE
jgi:ABC-type glycerol-3-phosphate transport system permease component